MDAIYIKEILTCLTYMTVQPQELQNLLLANVIWYVREVRGVIEVTYFQNIVFKCPLI